MEPSQSPLEAVELVLVMPAVAVAVTAVARRIRVADPIVLLIAGVVLGLIPGLPRIELQPDLVFALFLYRNWRLPVAMLAGAGAGLAMAINDLVIYYAGAATLFTTTYIVSGVIGGALIAGGLSWHAVRGLARAGALDRFAAGRERRGV